MAKISGFVGFSGPSVCTAPGVYSIPEVVERPFYGDVFNMAHREDTSKSVVNDINLNQRISFIAEPYFFEHLSHMLYVKLHGCKWKVASVTPLYPRITLEVGGPYNE